MHTGLASTGFLPPRVCQVARTTMSTTITTTTVVAGGAVAATGCLIMGRCACWS